jgi:hypothetical protein
MPLVLLRWCLCHCKTTTVPMPLVQLRWCLCHLSYYDGAYATCTTTMVPMPLVQLRWCLCHLYNYDGAYATCTTTMVHRLPSLLTCIPYHAYYAGGCVNGTNMLIQHILDHLITRAVSKLLTFALYNIDSSSHHAQLPGMSIGVPG